MKQDILKLKLELKNLSKKIRIEKNKRKSRENGYVAGLMSLRNYYRHRHVLYCLARGRTLEQVDSGKGLNMDYINFQLEAIKEDKKLYVIMDKNLPAKVMTVQTAHVVAEFLKKNPNTMWKNGTLVVLKTEIRGRYGFTWFPSEYAEFKEPDMKDAVTGYAVFGPNLEKHFKDLPLV